METLHTKVVVVQPIHEVGMKILNENIETVLLVGNGAPEAVLPVLDETVTGVLIRNSVFNREMIERAPNLKVISRHGVGVELVDLEAATEHGVLVVNAPEATTESVAEHIVAMVMILGRKMLIAHKELRAGNFGVRDVYRPDDIGGKTIGFIGFGRIGRSAARKCAGLGMRILTYTRHGLPAADMEAGVECCPSVEDLLQRADFVSLNVPLTSETRHMIGAEQLALMKPTAYLINCARGSVVDEAALTAALTCGQIAGAGLDVFEPEPPVRDNPLFKLDNVVVTPHSAAFTMQGKIRASRTAAQQLVDVLRGKVPQHLVNPNCLA